MKTLQAENLLIALDEFKNIKGKVGVRIARNKRMIEEELREYFQFKLEIFQKYGEEKDGSLIIDTKGENYKKFVEEIQPLWDEEVNFNFKTVTDEELEENGDLTSEQCEFIMQYFYDNSNV